VDLTKGAFSRIARLDDGVVSIKVELIKKGVKHGKQLRSSLPRGKHCGTDLAERAARRGNRRV
jgi:rare lipoprotein A (peptidoglycan hydrolase)